MLNTTGIPNTNHYNLGRGKVFFAPLDPTTGRPLGFRDLGNSPEFSINLDSETLAHLSSMAGLRVTDKEVLISQTMNLSLTLDEISAQNKALFMSGEVAELVNPIKTAQTKHEAYASVELGRWYDIINAAGAQVYDIPLTSTITFNNGSTDDALVHGTDFTLDLEFGRVFLLTTATKITTGVPLDITWSAAAGQKDVDEVRALTQTSVQGALRFLSENPAAGGARRQYTFHQVSLKAEGDFPLIGDDWTTMGFTAVAEANQLASPNSPTLTIRAIAAA